MSNLNEYVTHAEQNELLQGLTITLKEMFEASESRMRIHVEACVGKAVDVISARMDRMDHRMDAMEEHMGVMTEKLVSLDMRMTAVESSVKQLQSDVSELKSDMKDVKEHLEIHDEEIFDLRKAK